MYAHAKHLVNRGYEVYVLTSCLAPSVIRARASEARSYWERMVRDLKYRTALYSYGCSPTSRLRLLVLSILGGTYRSSERGGFGLRGLAKDVTFGLFGRPSPKESGTEAGSMGDS